MFEDQMATYCFVEIAEGFCPSSKSSAGLELAPELPPPSPKALSSSDSVDKPVSSPYWTMTNSSPAFVIRVPNESIVRLFSFLVSLYIIKNFQAQVQVPGQVQKVQGLRTKDLDLG